MVAITELLPPERWPWEIETEPLPDADREVEEEHRSSFNTSFSQSLIPHPCRPGHPAPVRLNQDQRQQSANSTFHSLCKKAL